MVVFIGQHNICKTFKYLPKQKTVTRKCNFIDMQVYWAYQIQFIFLDILSVYFLAIVICMKISFAKSGDY